MQDPGTQGHTPRTSCRTKEHQYTDPGISVKSSGTPLCSTEPGILDRALKHHVLLTLEQQQEPWNTSQSMEPQYTTLEHHKGLWNPSIQPWNIIKDPGTPV